MRTLTTLAASTLFAAILVGCDSSGGSASSEAATPKPPPAEKYDAPGSNLSGPVKNEDAPPAPADDEEEGD